jgi:hypothetical protein
MGNAKAEKEAEQKLRDFTLDNVGLRCPDASTLHAMIPYVKRLVRLFPQIKKDIKDKLSSSEIINKVCQEETQRYIKEIHPNALDFNTCALGLKEFLESAQQIGQLRMTDGGAWTGITEIYWVLQNTSSTPNYNSEGQYTILQLKWLLTVSRVINLNALFKSIQTPHLLLIECEAIFTVNDELRDMFKELFCIMKEKSNIKIILTTPSEGEISDCIGEIAAAALGEGFKRKDEQLSWNDLNTSSKTKLLEKTVIFQGRPVALNHLTSYYSMTDSIPLANLLHEKELRIGKEPVPSASSGYNEKYYIDRTLSYNNVMRQDIAIDEREGKFADLLASTEQEFKEL